MKRPVILVLLLAIPLELASFFFMPFPLDVGLTDDANWFTKFMGLRWISMHWIGLELSRWFDGHDLLTAWAIIFGGYLEIAVVLYLALLAVRAVRNRTGSKPLN